MPPEYLSHSFTHETILAPEMIMQANRYPHSILFSACMIFILAFITGHHDHARAAGTKPHATKISVPVDNCRARVISLLPRKEGKLENNRDVLANFDVEEMNCSLGELKLKTSYPVVIEEYPFTSFKVGSNAMFGAQLAGQANRFLPKDKYPTDLELNQRQEKIFTIMSLAGVGIARDFRSYGTRRFFIEKEKGQYDFKYSDFLAGLSTKYKIELIGRLSPHFGNPRKAGPPRDMPAYLAYVAAVVERYDGDTDFGCSIEPPDCYRKKDTQYPIFKGEAENWAQQHRISYWEILKEPAPGKRARIGNDAGLEPAQATKIYREVKSVINKNSPGVKVYFGGMGPIARGKHTKESYFRTMLNNGAGSSIDILGVAAFVEQVPDVVEKYRSMLLDFTSSKPIWVGQTGAPDRSFGRRSPITKGGSTELQIEYMVKSHVQAFTAGAEKVFWGDYLDNSKLANKRSSIWDSTGLFETETWNLKPAYYTYKLMATVLKDFVSVKRISSQIYKFQFSNRSPIYIVIPE